MNREILQRQKISTGIIKTKVFDKLIYNYQIFVFKRNILLKETYDSHIEIKDELYLFYLYNQKNCIGKYLIINTEDFNEFLQKYFSKPVKKSKDTEGFLLDYIKKDLVIRRELTGSFYQLKLYQFKELENKLISNTIDKDLQEEIGSIKIFMKTNLNNIYINENTCEITTSEIKLIYKTSKIYELKSKKYKAIVSVYFHKVIKYYEINVFFPHSCRNFVTNIHNSDISNIPKDAYLFLEENPDCTEVDIWKHYLKNSKIVNNKEGNGFLQFYNVSVLLRERLYQGYEIINRINIILIEIYLKSSFKMLVSDIDHVVSKIDMEYSNFILQVFSFEKNAWHKEIFLVKELYETYKNFKNKTDDKYLNYSLILDLAKMVGKHSSSDKMKFEVSENSDKKDVGMKKLISNLRGDKPSFDKVKELYEKPLNCSTDNTIYTETICANPCIIGKVGLNLSKQTIYINFYLPIKSQNNKLSIPFDEVRDMFVPFFNTLVNSSSVILGKRILSHYKTLFLNSPAFIKLLK